MIELATKQHTKDILKIAKQCGMYDGVAAFINQNGSALNGATAIDIKDGQITGFACIENYHTPAEKVFGRSVSKVLYLGVKIEYRGTTAAANLVKWLIDRNRSKYLIASIADHNGPLAGIAELYGFKPKKKGADSYPYTHVYTNPFI